MQRHESFMRWALALALEGAGSVSPNPMVGALVVKRGKILGEGYHRRAGLAHAEVEALRQAGGRAKGADLYVTLEPCCHYGRTPPCVQAIRDAGIERVIMGMRDPNPLVNGRGMRALRRSGIEVIEGVLEESCQAINEAYRMFITTGLPFVRAKVAVTLDGKIAAPDGSSRWITNEACRGYVQKLRSGVDAIAVGGGTIRRDDPRLTVRLEGWKGLHPKVIIFDEMLNISPRARVLRRQAGEVIIATTNRASSARVERFRRAGHQVLICRKTADARVSLVDALRRVGALGITSLLLEGGGEIFSSFMRQGLLDALTVCIAPKVLGGKGRDFLPTFFRRRMQDALALTEVAIKTFGDNVVIEGRMPRQARSRVKRKRG